MTPRSSVRKNVPEPVRHLRAVHQEVFEQRRLGWWEKVFFRITDLFLSRKRLPWVLIDVALIVVPFMGVRVTPQVTATYVAIWTLLSLGLDFFHRDKRFIPLHFVRISVLSTLVSLAATTLIFAVTEWDFGAEWTFGFRRPIYGVAGAFAAIQLFHACVAAFLTSSPKAFAIVGEQTAVSSEIVRYFSAQAEIWDIRHYYRYVGKFRDDTIFHISDLVVTKKGINDPRLARVIVHALESGCRVVHETEFYAEAFDRLPIDWDTKEWSFLLGVNNRQLVNDALKRGFDVLASLFALLVLSPVLALIAAAIKLTSFGPVFFVQPRQGRFWLPFSIYKFRTMYMSDPTAVSRFTTANDPRVTWVGRILRKYHLDELPQLVNILKGEMSIIGPRPEMVHFAKDMQCEIPVYEFRYMVRPGLSGLAQITQGYAGDNVEDTRLKLSYDFQYIKNHTFVLDLLIVLRTMFFIWNDQTYKNHK